MQRYLEIHCVYFKGSGKFYSQASGRFDIELFKGLFYPKEYGEKLRELKMLPGLESGTWRYSFMVSIGTYPELVLPED